VEISLFLLESPQQFRELIILLSAPVRILRLKNEQQTLQFVDLHLRNLHLNCCSSILVYLADHLLHFMKLFDSMNLIWNF
jgi:hypothetical protein